MAIFADFHHLDNPAVQGTIFHRRCKKTTVREVYSYGDRHEQE